MEPEGEIPLMRNGNAPMVFIFPRLAAVMLILTGYRSDLCIESCGNKFSPERHDWHPVSAIAEYGTVGVGLQREVGNPSDLASSGTARIVTLMKGCGSDARFSQALQNSLYMWWSSDTE